MGQPQVRAPSSAGDPASGDVLATIDVGARPVRSQPADGRMIVRTSDAYVAIDPASNTVVATLPKPDVGPAADRGWAVDGALWICDGQRLHRYDPTTIQPTRTVIELGMDCGIRRHDTDLVVALHLQRGPRRIRQAAAVFIDPTTNQVLDHHDLPPTSPCRSSSTTPSSSPRRWADQCRRRPIQLDGHRDPRLRRRSVTPPGGHSTDGRSTSSPTTRTCLLIDADTYEPDRRHRAAHFIVDQLNALAVGPGALWVATGCAGILQRFDIPS